MSRSTELDGFGRAASAATTRPGSERSDRTLRVREPGRRRGESGVEVTVLMPCLDEERTVGGCVARALETLARHGIRGEVVVADNGSRDRSREVAAEAGARVIAVPVRGYGAALARGIEAARGRYVVMGDSDGSYDFGELPRILEPLRSGRDLVLGNRYRGGIHPRAMPPLHRYLGNPALTAIGRLFFDSPVRDIYCGLRGFRRDGVLALGLESRGMEFALEMVVKATLQGLSIAEVPVTLSPDGRGRPPHLNTWRDGVRSLHFLLSYSPRWLFLHPGLALVGVGLGLAAALLARARPLHGVEVDLATLVYGGAAISVGLQLVIFSVVAKKLAIELGRHPRDGGFERLLAHLRPGACTVLGTVLIAFGAACGLVSDSLWSSDAHAGFGSAVALRTAIPAAVAITAGCEVLFSGLLLGLVAGRRASMPR
jgi:hypothetical protein